MDVFNITAVLKKVYMVVHSELTCGRVNLKEGGIIYNQNVFKGKKLVLLIIASINIYYLISMLLSLYLRHNESLIKQIFEIVTIVLISFLFYKGFKVAEWFAFALLIEPALTIIFYMLGIMGALELYNGLLIFLVIILIGIIGISVNNGINEFMKYQRDKTKEFHK